MSGRTSKRYPVELRERAVRMVGEIRADHESEWAAMTQVAQLLGIGTPETVRKWCRQAEVDAGKRSGVTSEETAELKRLKRENAELKRANAILRRLRLSSRPNSTGHSADRGLHRPRSPQRDAEAVCDGVSSRSAPSSPSWASRSPHRPTTSTAAAAASAARSGTQSCGR